jgi:hypothetical protein
MPPVPRGRRARSPSEGCRCVHGSKTDGRSADRAEESPGPARPTTESPSACRYSQSQATPARRPATGSSWPSIDHCSHGCCQRRCVDRARDPHPNAGHKLNLDCTPPAEPTGAGAASNSGDTIAGTKPCCCSTPSLRSARNARRHRISNDRDMPYRRAVAEICRGVCKLSRTILSFSSSVQRRRRPVSTTSSRSTWVLRLSLSIRTVLTTEPHLTRRPSAKGYRTPSEPRPSLQTFDSED